ncbi:MAG: hypothetical protein WCJ30_25630, partial [Deltaproteobacteria bacterium]
MPTSYLLPTQTGRVLRAGTRGSLVALIASLALGACALSHHGATDAASDRLPPTSDSLDVASDHPDAPGDADGGDGGDGGDGRDGDQADVATCEAGVLCGAACVDTATDVH